MEKARKHRDAHTYTALGWDEFVETINTKPGFVKAMWCGCQECEDKKICGKAEWNHVQVAGTKGNGTEQKN